MRSSYRNRAAAVVLACWAAAASAATTEQLALQITEARADMRALDERLARLESQLKSQGLFSLLNQLNELKIEVAKLRGQNDELTHAIDTVTERQKTLYADMDGRLKALDGQLQDLASSTQQANTGVQETASIAAGKSGAVPDAVSENRAYEAALAHFRSGNYTEALVAFQGFLREYPNGALASNAHYWIGLAFATQGDYKSAAFAYEKLLQDFPGSSKIPDATLSLARARLQLGEMDSARTLLNKVVSQYGGTRAAENARKLLATLK